MPQIIDSCVLDAGDFEIAVDCGPDVPNQERAPSFGHKEGFVSRFWALLNIVCQRFAGGFRQGNCAWPVGFIGSHRKYALFEIYIIEF